MSAAITPEWLPALPEHAPAPIAVDAAALRVYRDPLNADITSLDLTTGVSLMYALRETFRLNGISRRMLRKKWCKVEVGMGPFGEMYEVPFHEWGTFMIRPGMHILVTPKTMGGGGKKNPLATILSIVVVIVAIIATWYVGGAGGWMGMGTLGAGWGSLAGTAVMVGGMMLVNMICPPAALKLTSGDSLSAEDTWSISGTQNRASLYEMIPWVFGKVRFAPRYLANPYTLLKGSDQYLRCLFGVAGHNKVSDIRIGDTPIGTYQGVRLNVYENWRGESFEFITSSIFQEDTNINMVNESGWFTRTTTDDTLEIQFELFFQQGLMYFKGNNRYGARVTFDVQYRKEGAAQWTGFFNGSSELSISEKTQTPFRRGYNLHVPQGRYEFRIRRNLLYYASGGVADLDDTSRTFIHASIWSAFRSVQAGPVLAYDGAPLTVFELEIKATDQLNGAINEFNAVFESYAPVWDGNKWVEKPANNPASLGLLLATSPHVRRVVPADAWGFIDSNAWRGFYEWCVRYGWTYNSVQTSQESVREVLQNILASARAALAFRNNLYSVVWDHPDKEVVYPFGPRNSWGFTFSKTFVKEQPHGLRVRFLNETRDFQEDEKIVYADGYNKTNAMNIIEAEFDGVTNPDLIFKMGRLRLADSIWRPAIYEVSTDFAFLAVQKGDRVAVTHDVPMWGIVQVRVVGQEYAAYDFEDMGRDDIVALALERKGQINPEASLAAYNAMLDGMDAEALVALLESRRIRDESRVQGIYIDDHVAMDGESLYALKRYNATGPGDAFSVRSEPITTSLLFFSAEIPASTAPGHGDLIHFGLASRETHDCIVVAIEPQESMTAKITMQDYSVKQIYAALTGPIPPWDSDITIPSRWQLVKPLAPVLTSYQTDELVLLVLSNGTLVPRIQAGFAVAERFGVELDRVRIQVRRTGSGEAWTDMGTAPAASGFVYAEGVEERVTYDIRLYAISMGGVHSDFSPIYPNITVIGRTTPPPAPIRVNIDGSRIWWEMPEDAPIDVRGWEVWMGFDAQDAFLYARRLTSPITQVMEFDLTGWQGWARRVWVRSVDDIGLVSETVSVAINLGDILVDNVVETHLEGEERGWPGTVINGAASIAGLTPESVNPFWQRGVFWSSNRFWRSEGNYSLTYSTSLLITEVERESFLSLDIDIPYGTLASVEYRFVSTGPFWNRANFWSSASFWTLEEESDWQIMPSKLWISGESGERIIRVRVITAEGSAGLIREIKWIFDVEDEEESVDNLEVPAEGTRIPLVKSFRSIKNIQASLEYYEGGTANSAVWADRGIIEDGRIVEGPLIFCIDSSRNRVPGVVDVRIQGVKGVTI